MNNDKNRKRQNKDKNKDIKKTPPIWELSVGGLFLTKQENKHFSFFLVSEFGFKTYILMCAYWVADQKPYIFIPVSGL